MVIDLRKIYFTVDFKGLFSVILVGCLIFSFIFLISTTENLSMTSADIKIEKANNRRSIIIDAGHGGEDGGTSSSKGTKEKDINLKISLKLCCLLELCGYNTIMTRTEDKLIYNGNLKTIREKKSSDLSNRLKIAESNPDAIFLSIHQNYFAESKYSGTQVFYSKNNPLSFILAEEIQNAVISDLQNNNTRKIKPSGKEIFILYKAKSPSVMVECGFMSNYSESLKLEDDHYQLEISLSVINGINNYYDKKGEI